MKKVIKGLLYDTEKSILVYQDTATRRQLWKTVNKTFFFTFQNGSIEPVTTEGAKEYLGLVDVEAYIKVFGDPKEA